MLLYLLPVGVIYHQWITTRVSTAIAYILPHSINSKNYSRPSPIPHFIYFIIVTGGLRIIYTVQDDTGRNQANPVIHTYVCSFLMCRESARTLLSTGDIPYLDGFQYFRNTGGQWGHPWTSLVLDLEPPLVVLLLCGWNITLKITIQRKRTRKIIGNVLHYW